MNQGSDFRRPDDSVLRAIFAATRTIAVVGASKNPARASFSVGQFLLRKGYRVIPVNPTYAGAALFGEVVYPDLASLPADIGVDMVDIFRRSDRAGAVVDEALRHLLGRGLSTIWMQLGVIDEAAAARAGAAGVRVVMDRCPAIDLPRLNAGPGQAPARPE